MVFLFIYLYQKGCREDLLLKEHVGITDVNMALECKRTVDNFWSTFLELQ